MGFKGLESTLCTVNTVRSAVWVRKGTGKVGIAGGGVRGHGDGALLFSSPRTARPGSAASLELVQRGVCILQGILIVFILPELGQNS